MDRMGWDDEDHSEWYKKNPPAKPDIKIKGESISYTDSPAYSGSTIFDIETPPKSLFKVVTGIPEFDNMLSNGVSVEDIVESYLDPVVDMWSRPKTSSGEKKVFKIDVGNIPEEEMERYVQILADKFKTVPVMEVEAQYFNPLTGKVSRTKVIEENPKYIVEINFNPRNFEYESVWMNLNGYKVAEQFGTGDFVKDWFIAMNYFISNAQQGDFVMFGSTVPIFTQHHPEFETQYLVENNGFLGFVDLPLSFNFRESEKIRFFVPRNTILTWEDLKRICIQ